MRIRFHSSDKPRERSLASAFAEGAARHGHECEIVPLGSFPPFDRFTAACMVGVKSAALFRACEQAGVVPIMFDKGYVRDRRVGSRVWEFWRVSVGAHHPTEHLMDDRLPDDRLNAHLNAEGRELRSWRRRGEHILLAGSSAKYHQFYGLEDPTQWARAVIKRLREITCRPIIYRPKPSWRDATPITKTLYSGPSDKLKPIFENTWAIVTHGSNISFEGALAGVPSIVLGNGIGKPISSTSLEDIDAPLLGRRRQWLQNLCYYQWTEDEMREGAMMEFIAPQIVARAQP